MDGADFAAWNAGRWAVLYPEMGTDAALLAVRFMKTADDLARSHAQTLAPWRHRGIASVDDFRTLSFIRLSDPPGPQAKSIVSALGSTRGTISNRLERLQGDGWIVRSPIADDLRSHTLAVAADRIEEVDAMYSALVANHHQFFELLTKTEVGLFIKALSKLNNV